MDKYTTLRRRELLKELGSLYKVGRQIKCPHDVIAELAKWIGYKQERFFLITLSSAHKVISTTTITIGTANKTLVHPRDVFRRAIADNATSIIVSHNHPSGSLTMSPEDQKITKTIKEAGEIIGIGLLDHIIFSHRGYFSYEENQKFDFGTKPIKEPMKFPPDNWQHRDCVW